jgi:hypothetical protein
MAAASTTTATTEKKKKKKKEEEEDTTDTTVTSLVVPEDILAMTFSERHAYTLNIDGQLIDSATVAGVLREAKNRRNVRELLLRNVQVDELVAEGIEDLFHNSGKIWTKTEAIHCSGLLSRMIRAVLPYTSHFGFTGNVPIAHNPRYGLDQESLEALGNQLLSSSLSSSCLRGNSSNHSTTPTTTRSLLSTLSIKGSRLTNPGFGCFCQGIRASTTLSILQLSCCALEGEDVILLASALRENHFLKSLSLADCRFGSIYLHVHPQEETVMGMGMASSDNNDDNADEHDIHVDEHDPISDPSVAAVAAASPSSIDIPAETETTITQSTNNTNPQSHFSILLEALIQHPTLEVLNIFGMYCNDLSMAALGEMLKFPQSKLWHLGLKNNLSHPDDRVNVSFLWQALHQNTKLTYLKLSGANLNDKDVEMLGTILSTTNTTLRALSITDNAFGDTGLLTLALRLATMKGLRFLDVQRNPITSVSKRAMVAALKDNVELERLDLDGTWDAKKAWWLCLNRAGRRLLSRSDNNVPSSLWPVILDRASKLQFGRNQAITINHDVMYYMLRRLPWLFEIATSGNDHEVDVDDDDDNRKRLYHSISMNGYNSLTNINNNNINNSSSSGTNINNISNNNHTEIGDSLDSKPKAKRRIREER